jgi:anti-sigma B factor antagonist
MDFEMRKEGTAAVFEVSGSINSVHSPRLREAMTKAFKNSPKGMIIDLSQVGYIDSSGLATLVEGIQLSESNNVKFMISGKLDEKIQHMLEITRLTELFIHYPTLDEALSHVTSMS